MGKTWIITTVNLDPWSYQNLLLRWRILAQTQPDLSKSGALRYILRRQRFTKEQKQFYTEQVNKILEDKNPEALDVIRAHEGAPPLNSR